MLRFEFSFLVIKFIDVSEELLLPSIKLKHLCMVESFGTLVVALVSFNIEDSPSLSMELGLIFVDLPKEGVQEDSSEGKPAKICIKKVYCKEYLEWSLKES